MQAQTIFILYIQNKIDDLVIGYILIALNIELACVSTGLDSLTTQVRHCYMEITEEAWKLLQAQTIFILYSQNKLVDLVIGYILIALNLLVFFLLVCIRLLPKLVTVIWRLLKKLGSFCKRQLYSSNIYKTN